MRPADHLAAWSLTVSALVVLAAALVLLGLNASRLDAGRIGFYGLLSVGVLAYAGVGSSWAGYSAERMLAAFAARLTEELDADAVTEDLARSVHAALDLPTSPSGSASGLADVPARPPSHRADCQSYTYVQ